MPQPSETLPTSGAGFGSRDFVKTQSSLRARVPERLLHADVEGRQSGASSRDATFDLERKHPVHVVDLPSQTISMTLGGLEPGQRTNRHRHNYETIIYVLEGEGESVIEDRVVQWKAGDAFYVPVWAWHHHRNLNPDRGARYVACENAPLLQNLGRLDLREEEP
jgi:gentisate 1,2-dioxygenase